MRSSSVIRWTRKAVRRHGGRRSGSRRRAACSLNRHPPSLAGPGLPFSHPTHSQGSACAGSDRGVGDVTKVALAAVDPDQLLACCRADGLGRLASVLGVAKTGSKPAVAARIVARGRLLDRPLYLGGDEPAAVARTFRTESLRLLVAELGGFVGVRKYGPTSKRDAAEH